MFVFNFGIESLGQSVKLNRFVISISLAIPFSEHPFFQTDNQKAVLFTVFSLLELFFSCCIVVAVAKENLLKTPAIVSLANFQILLRHPRLAFDWLSVSSFDYWPIRMSGLLLSLHWINPLLHWITWKLHLSILLISKMFKILLLKHTHLTLPYAPTYNAMPVWLLMEGGW